MTLKNKLGITEQAELAREEERLGKKRALELFERGLLDGMTPGTAESLFAIHGHLFQDIYGFAGKTRGENIAKGGFGFAPVMCLEASLEDIEEMPQSSFGELFMLMEPDKRGVSLQLLYANEQFGVPANLYLIGMMNTADRSLAMMDYALRRRFAFYEIAPAFDSDAFRAYRSELASDKFDRLVATVEQLNAAIESDDSLGRGFRIGHSYFCGIREAIDDRLAQIVDFELAPLLEEYWFDEPTKVADWSARLRSALR